MKTKLVFIWGFTILGFVFQAQPVEAATHDKTKTFSAVKTGPKGNTHHSTVTVDETTHKATVSGMTTNKQGEAVSTSSGTITVDNGTTTTSETINTMSGKKVSGKTKITKSSADSETITHTMSGSGRTTSGEKTITKNSDGSVSIS